MSSLYCLWNKFCFTWLEATITGWDELQKCLVGLILELLLDGRVLNVASELIDLGNKLILKDSYHIHDKLFVEYVILI